MFCPPTRAPATSRCFRPRRRPGSSCSRKTAGVGSNSRRKAQRTVTPVVGAELLWSTVDEAASAVVRTFHLGDRYDLDPIDVAYPQMSSRLRRVGPSVLCSTGGSLAVLAAARACLRGRRSRRGQASGVDRDRATLAGHDSRVAGRSRRRWPSGEARGRVVLDALLADVQVRAGWRVRPAANAPLPVLAGQAGLTWRLPMVVLAHATVYAVFLAVWALVGRQRRFEVSSTPAQWRSAPGGSWPSCR